MPILVNLPPSWTDTSNENPNGPPTFIPATSKQSGAFQVSWAEYKGGEIPNPSQNDLKELSVKFGLAKQLEGIESTQGECDFGNYGTAVFQGNGLVRAQLWTISDGRNFIRATHICITEPDEAEIEEADQIARALRLS